jgi:flagellar hook-length control protein FliK
VPSIASQVNAALKPASQPPLPAPDRASAAPFDSLLDDSTPRAAQPEPPAKPAPDDKPEPSPRAQADAKAAPAKDKEPAKKPAKDIKADGGKAEKHGKADKPGKAGASDDCKTGDAKTEAKTDTQSTAEAVLAAPDSAQATDTSSAATALPVATAVASAAAVPVEGANADAAAKTSVPVAATQVVAAVTASTTAATKSATPGADKTSIDKTSIDKTSIDKTGADKTAKIKTDLTAPQENVDAPDGATKATAKHTTPAQPDAKSDVDDKQAAPAPTEHAATADAGAAKQAVVKPSTDLLQPLAMTAPALHAPAANAAAPGPQLAAQLVSQAVPLAGIPLEIAGKALAGNNHFEIRLDPPELGRIEVRLDVGKDGSISSHVIADRKDTLDLLQRDGASLQRAFEDAGLKTSDQSMQFSLRDHSAGREQNAAAADMAQLVIEDETSLDPLPLYNRLASARGGLDIRV